MKETLKWKRCLFVVDVGLAAAETEWEPWKKKLNGHRLIINWLMMNIMREGGGLLLSLDSSVLYQFT